MTVIPSWLRAPPPRLRSHNGGYDDFLLTSCAIFLTTHIPGELGVLGGLDKTEYTNLGVFLHANGWAFYYEKA